MAGIPLQRSIPTASFATISWYWRATAYRCGTAWPASRSAKRSLGRRRNGGHPAPRRFASAISRGKTIHGSLFSSHSPIPTDERGGEDGQGSSGLAVRGTPSPDWDIRAMKQSTASRILVGPYGLHAFGFVVLAFFLAFLWVFNFTTFF